MNRAELTAAVAQKTGLSKAAADQAVEAVFATIGATLKKGEDVRILGFGSFVVTERSATSGRNPQTGESITIRASRLAKFRPGQGLKDMLND